MAGRASSFRRTGRVRRDGRKADGCSGDGQGLPSADVRRLGEGGSAVCTQRRQRRWAVGWERAAGRWESLAARWKRNRTPDEDEDEGADGVSVAFDAGPDLL